MEQKGGEKHFCVWLTTQKSFFSNKSKWNRSLISQLLEDVFLAVHMCVECKWLS